MRHVDGGAAIETMPIVTGRSPKRSDAKDPSYTDRGVLALKAEVPEIKSDW